MTDGVDESKVVLFLGYCFGPFFLGVGAHDSGDCRTGIDKGASSFFLVACFFFSLPRVWCAGLLDGPLEFRID